MVLSDFSVQPVNAGWENYTEFSFSVSEAKQTAKKTNLTLKLQGKVTFESFSQVDCMTFTLS